MLDLQYNQWEGSHRDGLRGEMAGATKRVSEEVAISSNNHISQVICMALRLMSLPIPEKKYIFYLGRIKLC